MANGEPPPGSRVSPLSAFVLSHAPALYDPDPEIFCERQIHGEPGDYRAAARRLRPPRRRGHEAAGGRRNRSAPAGALRDPARLLSGAAAAGERPRGSRLYHSTRWICRGGGQATRSGRPRAHPRQGKRTREPLVASGTTSMRALPASRRRARPQSPSTPRCIDIRGTYVIMYPSCVSFRLSRRGPFGPGRLPLGWPPCGSRAEVTGDPLGRLSTYASAQETQKPVREGSRYVRQGGVGRSEPRDGRARRGRHFQSRACSSPAVRGRCSRK
jgi:hypothetical protein